MAADLTAKAEEVLRALSTDKCVLIKGVPAAGKSMLLAEVRRLFAQGGGGTALSTPDQQVAISVGPTGGGPSPGRQNREVWQTVMNQNSRFKDFWCGTEPILDGSPGFTSSEGVLYRANEHAREEDSASLVTVDELNRGPAVNVFGPSLVAIEADKRTADDGSVVDTTATFELHTPVGLEEYSLSPHLYIVCAQNNADTSVEAIDTAFLRRFTPIELEPDPAVLIAHFGLSGLDGDLPDEPGSPQDVYRAAVRAWIKTNEKLAVGASPDFRIGHGALINAGEEVPDSIDTAKSYVARGWAIVDQHVGEVFYGKPEDIAAAFWVNEGGSHHPYRLEDAPFGDVDRTVLKRGDADLYTLLRVIATAA